MKPITLVSATSIYMFFSMFGMLSVVTGAAIPNPATHVHERSPQLPPLPVPDPGLPVPVPDPGLPVPDPGLPVPGPGLPVPDPGLPVPVPGLPV